MRSLLNSASHVCFAASAEAGSDTAKVIDKAVYLKGDDTIKSVVAHAEAAAGGNLAFCAAMVVHITTRLYTPIIAERVKMDDVKTEILNAVREHGHAKKGKEFGRAWSYKILSLAIAMGRSLMTDYDRKGVVDGSPLQTILRSKSVEKAVETVMTFITGKTKGQNNLQSLEAALAPAKAKAKAGKAKAGAKKGAVSNNQRPQTAAVTAKALMSDKTADVIQAIPAKSAKQRGEKLADKIGGANNVDHAAFIMRSLNFVTDPAKLLEIADHATELAKAIGEKDDQGGKLAATG